MVAGTGPPKKDATGIHKTRNLLGLKSIEELDTIWRQEYQIFFIWKIEDEYGNCFVDQNDLLQVITFVF